MKKLLTITAILSLSSLSFAGSGTEKIDTDFDSLDNNGDAYISKEEADDNNIWDHFNRIDTDKDGQLSKEEYMTYAQNHPDAVEEGENLMEEAE